MRENISTLLLVTHSIVILPKLLSSRVVYGIDHEKYKYLRAKIRGTKFGEKCVS